MAIDPSIALGVRPIEVPNQLSQFAQAQQIQHYQQQNALADRAIQQEDALNRAYASSIDPATGQIDANMLRRNMATGGIASKLPAAEKSLMEGRKLSNEVGKGELELGLAKANQGIRELARYDTLADVNAHIDQNLAAGKITAEQAAQTRAGLPKSDADMPKWQIGMLRKTLDAKDQLEQHFTSQDFGGGTRIVATPKFAGGAPATVVPNTEVAKTQTFADKNAAARLAFDQGKFAWEKANPGFELKETENGDIVGINKRTLQAFPVSLGGAAPMAGGGAPVAGAQPTAAAPAGVPLKGKGTALTESQGNATAYGMRMLESDKLLRDLEKSGTTSGGRIKGVVEGTLNALVPFQGEKLAEGAGNIMNVLPSVMGGPNENQQMYEQAKKNFITAVLRKESGAAIGQNEFVTEEKKYFPQAGESDKVIAQKQRARDLAIQAMKIQAGPGSKNIGGADPLGIR
jgi:hypothetical protein